MNVLRRLYWWYTGEVAEIVVERYEDPIDAVIAPLVSGILVVLTGSVALDWVMGSPSINGPLGGFIVAIGAATICAAALFMFTTSIAATGVYATQRTEVEVSG